MDFVKEWEGTTREQADAKPFWVDFFSIFGIKRRHVAAFEHPVKKIDGHTGFIDLLWPGVILIEHKSRGEDLVKAKAQAIGYLKTLPDVACPQYVLICDFNRFLLENLDTCHLVEFTLDQLPDRLGHFAFFTDKSAREIEAQVPITIEAVDVLDQLHNELEKAGYKGHDLEVFMVRILYCLFAEDTGIFAPNQFTRLLKEHTDEDGSDTGAMLSHLFQILNTPPEKRSKALKPHLDFAYINGNLFAETIQIPDFDASMRQKLIRCSGLDWSLISPAVFGALFQGIMDKQSRRQGGAHYTSEKNILKVIEPLFLDDLWTEFEKCKGNLAKIRNFHKKLATLRFLDPACGCGNFLVVTYRELRLLELEALQELNRTGQLFLDAAQAAKVNVDQFYGIEIEEFPAQISRVALWLTDHLENRKLERCFGTAYARIPLITSPNITHGNALQLDWAKVLPPGQCTAVMGNPPFVGKSRRTPQQDVDMAEIMGQLPKWRIVDHVANWHIKALGYIKGTEMPVGFVSTNSICQGEQVSALWPHLLNQGFKLNFAHRTFAWENEAKGKAGVHCIILGFSLAEKYEKKLWDYEDPKGEPTLEIVRNISPYLIPGPNIIVHPRNQPFKSDIPKMVYGSMPVDGGHYMFTPEEKAVFLDLEPGAAKFFRRCIGADEFINGIERWCLWLKDADPAELRKLPHVLNRIDAVRAFRISSQRAATRKQASRASEWQEIRHNGKPYIVVPRVSSEDRNYIPIGFMMGEIIATDRITMLPDASHYVFGVLCSLMHMAWMRTICGRLESRYNYSANVVYNTFPWPNIPSEKRRKAIEQAAQAVLNARTKHPSASLADLYDLRTMPAGLLKAHAALDKAVDLCYRPQSFDGERKRVEFLLELYEASR